MSHDSDLQLAVLAELNWQPSIVAAHIGVTAQDGIVTLSGHVESFIEKHRAQDAASRVRSVHAVVNELEVQLAFDHQRGDGAIAAAALDRLSWDASVPADAIRLDVDHGWVTMTGHVDSHFQKESAEQAIRPLVGVLGISNQVLVTPRLSATDISDTIMHALHRSWLFDPRTVTVSAEGGDIRLTGTVTSWHDRRIAAETAWAAPGVRAVENEIIVV
jgi:osmotically-inducible protein OsmY